MIKPINEHELDALHYQAPFVKVSIIKLNNSILRSSIEDGYDGGEDED